MTTPPPTSSSRRCGFVAVIGAPNAGKSTLINTLVGGKVTIVSPRVQTTRTLVRGIAINGDSQIVFIDTPGLFSPRKRMERAMVAAAWEAREEADIVVLMFDALRKGIDQETRSIIDRIKAEGTKQPCLLVLNKVDEVKPHMLMDHAQSLNKLYPFDATFMISATKADGTKDLLKDLTKRVPAGNWHYPEDQLGDMTERLLAAEITREKLFQKLYQEVPGSLTVETESWEAREDGSILLHQVIIVERGSQKAIVLGKGGAMIGAVGEESRRELSEILETPVHLKLFVRVREDWQNDPDFYRTWNLSDS